MPPLTESDVLDALRSCYDPELPCNIVDLGLVETITITADPDAPGANIPGVPERHLVQIRLLPRTDNEATQAQLSAQIANRFGGLPSVSHTEITVLDHARWSPLRITPAGRHLLGLDGNRNLVQIR